MRDSHAVAWGLVGVMSLSICAVLAVGVHTGPSKGEIEAALTPTAEDEVWLAALPRMAPALRERVDAIMGVEWPQHVVPVRGGDSWYLRGAPPEQGWVERHELRRRCAEAMSDLLRVDGVCLSSAAWEPREELGGAPTYREPRLPNLRVCRCAMQWYGVETMLADDPLPALALADRLYDSLQPVASVIDFLIRGSLGSMRDVIYARLALRGKLPDVRLQGWLNERCGARRSLLDAYRAERLLWNGPLARDVLANAPRAKNALYGDSMDLWELLDFHLHAEQDLLAIQDAYRLVQDHLEGRVEAAALDVIADRQAEGGRTLRLGTLSHQGMIWTLVTSRTQHHMIRLLVRIARLPGVLPADEQALRARLPEAKATLAAGPWDLQVRYQCLGADRFRLYVPEASPLPTVLESERSRLQYGESTPPQRSGPPPALHVRCNAVECALPH